MIAFTSVYDDFTARAVDAMGALRVGDPFGDVDAGALISGAARDRVV
jgi:acyl-CoA reductase-like NAD-dependent aldehyde dehydrogenase